MRKAPKPPETPPDVKNRIQKAATVGTALVALGMIIKAWWWSYQLGDTVDKIFMLFVTGIVLLFGAVASQIEP